MRVLKTLYDIGLALAALCIMLTTVLVLAQIGGRMMGLIVPSVPEVAGFLLGATIFLALPATMRAGEHIRITILLEALDLRLQLGLEFLYRLVGFAVLAFLTYRFYILTYDSWDFGDRSAGLVGIPIWIPQAAMTLGLALNVVRFAEEIVLLLVRRAPIAYPSAPRE